MYRTLILPVVFYGCETWSLILREEMKLRVFENMALKRIFGPRREKGLGLLPDDFESGNESSGSIKCVEFLD